MIKLNFQQFKIPTDIQHSAYKEGDVRETVANMLYRNVNGIRAHALAMKIFKSEGNTEYDELEVEFIKNMADTYGTPAFIDGLREQIINQ